MKRIAVIGTGISAMGAFYFLKDKYDITLYEKNNYPGGHTNTVTINEDGNPVFIDSAFMVYNEITYPNLTRLFKELDVKTKPTDMSFSVQHLPTGLEYCGTGFNGLFAQRKNILSVPFWKLLLEIDRFNKQALEVLEEERFQHYTIYEYAKERGFSREFLDKFLVPMSSAVWSTSGALMLEFPIVTLVMFFRNHGFLGGLKGHYQWRTVVEGSQRYREKILKGHEHRIKLNCAVKRVIRENGKAKVTDVTGRTDIYDMVIFASHADETLKILGDANALEKRLLGRFSYHKNKTTLHTDASIMPKEKVAWSSWNYRIGRNSDGLPFATTIYHMNNLQGVSTKQNYFVSINDSGEVDPAKVLWETVYDHPIYNVEAVKAQKDLPQLNKNGIIYFCGAYFKYGFHEDGLTSGLEVARAITGEGIWA